MVAQAHEGLRPIPSDGTIEPRPAGLRHLHAMESLKMRKRPMAWVIVALMLAASFGIPLLGYIAMNASEFASPAQKADQLSAFLLPKGIVTAIDVTSHVGQILLVVLAAGIIGSEYGWGTTRVLVGSGANRTKLMLAKVLYLARFSLCFLLAGALAGTVSSLIVTAFGGHDVSLGTVDGAWFADLGLMLARSYFTMLVPVAIGFGVSALSRSLAAGIAVGVGILALEPIVSVLLGLLGSVGDVLNQLLISPNANAILSLNGFGEVRPAPDALNPWQAAGVLLAYIVVLIGSSIIVFRRRDVPSGS